MLQHQNNIAQDNITQNNIIRHGPLTELAKIALDVLQHVLILIAFLMFFSFVQVATAEEDQSNSLFLVSQNPRVSLSALMVKTEIDMRITGMINRSKVTQVFKNTSNEWVEGIYQFPLPASAIVDALQIQMGGQVINADIKPRSEAMRHYQSAKNLNKRTALLEQHRPNIFNSSIANIAPGEEVRIEISFQYMARFEDGEFKLRFPMRVQPRYISGDIGTEQEDFNPGRLKKYKSSQVSSQTGGKSPVSLHIELDAGFPLAELESRYHAIKKTNHGLGRYSIRFKFGAVLAKRDLELFWRPEPGQLPRTALFHEKFKGEHYYFAMLYPQQSDQQPEMSAQALLNKEVVYLVDTSGSMAGASIRQARDTILSALTDLDPEDYFNIITFNTQTHSLFEQSKPASVFNVARARQFIAQSNARGGTEMFPALRKALTSQDSEHRRRQIIYLTDGAIINERDVFGLIRNNIKKNRLFTVGIGTSPNSYFLHKAAKVGRGSYTYIGDANEVSERLGKLLKKINRPQLQDIGLVINSGLVEVIPETIADLYESEPVIFSIKTKAPLAQIKLVGYRYGEEWSRQLSLNDSNNGFGIAKHWAHQKINMLTEDRSEQSEESINNLEKRMTDIALKHKIMSPYTSLVVVDRSLAHVRSRTQFQPAKPVILADKQSTFIKTSQVIPLSAKTATDAQLKLIVGLISLFLAIVVRIFLRRRYPSKEWF